MRFATVLAPFFSLALSLVASAQPATTRRPIAIPTERSTTLGLDAVVASNGSTFLTAWSDFRNGDADVHVLVSDTSGAILRPSSTLLATWRADQWPALVWDGERYVALVQSQLFGAFAVPVAADGSVGDARLVSEWPAEMYPVIAWTGSYYATIEKTIDGSWSVVLLDRDFRRVRTVGMSRFPVSATLASNGDGFIAVWRTASSTEVHIHAQRFSRDGAELGGVVSVNQALPGDSGSWDTYGSEPAVSWNGSAYLVVWGDNSGIRGMRIGETATSAIFTVVAWHGARNVAIGWDGRVHLIAWIGQGRAAAAFATSEGQALRMIPQTFALAAERPRIAAAGSTFLVVLDGSHSIVRSDDDAILSVAEPTAYFAAQQRPLIDSTATSLVAAWEEAGGMYYGRLSFDGRPLDAGGIRLGSLANSAQPFDLATTHDTTFVVWRERVAIRLVRISAEGQVPDEPIIIMGIGEDVVAAPTNGGVAVVWNENTGPFGNFSRRLMYASVGSTGGMTVERRPITEFQPGTVTPVVMRPTPSGVILIWKTIGASVCFPALAAAEACPPPPVSWWMAHIGPDGSILNRASLGPSALGNGILDAVADDERLYVLSQEYQTLSVRTFTHSGDPVGAPVSIPMARHVFDASIATTPAGFVIGAGDELILLDDTLSVRRRLPLPGDDRPTVSDLEMRGAQTWLAYTASWTPLPESHEGSIPRSFVGVSSPRVRAVGR